MMGEYGALVNSGGFSSSLSGIMDMLINFFHSSQGQLTEVVLGILLLFVLIRRR
jgi:hypothetical protein